MILNTGARTDIPAFYSKWFMNRIREGFVYVRNPFNPKKITKYILDPNLIDVLAFCTKNPKPMLEYIDELKKFRMFWFVTITPYGLDIEPNVNNKKDIINSFIELSKKIGSNALYLRYDPILITKKYSVEYHIKCFKRLCFLVSGYTNNIVISFIDIYEKLKKNAPDLKEVSESNQILITKEFSNIAKQYNINILLCLENKNLTNLGTNIKFGCMTKEILNNALNINIIKQDKSPREECGCLLGHDIGEYNTCMHLCRYCYANGDKKLVYKNYKNHNPLSPLLIGDVLEDDVIVDAKMESYIEKEVRNLFSEE